MQNYRRLMLDRKCQKCIVALVVLVEIETGKVFYKCASCGRWWNFDGQLTAHAKAQYQKWIGRGYAPPRDAAQALEAGREKG